MSFTIKSIKDHGMQDERWTIRNKITQYKGLMRLHDRDTKILNVDRKIAQGKVKQKYQQLKQDVLVQKRKLDNAIKNDQEQHRKTLENHRTFQVAFSDHTPTKTIEFVEHNNFRKRKELDRMLYELKKKRQILVESKLELAQYQDNLTYQQKPHREENTCKLISGKVKEAEIKKDGAIQIHKTYKKILTVLKKDTQYFDSVLDQLKMDTHYQSKFLYRVTEIGQLATEYADDRKQEYNELEKLIKRDMKSRLSQIKIFEEQMAVLGSTMKNLIQGTTEEPKSNSFASFSDYQIQHDLATVQIILKRIKEITCTANFENIAFCLQNQTKVNKKLTETYQKRVEEKNDLLEKLNNAKGVVSQNISDQETEDVNYTNKNEEICKQMEKLNAKFENVNNQLQIKLAKENQIKACLMHLHRVCRIIRPKVKKQPSTWESTSIQTNVVSPEKIELNTSKILSDLQRQLTLVLDTLEKLPPASSDSLTKLEIEKCYQTFIGQISFKQDLDNDKKFELSLMDDIFLKDPSIKTREEIKKQSQLLCEAHAPPDWMK